MPPFPLVAPAPHQVQCVCERERERERDSECLIQNIQYCMYGSKIVLAQSYLVLVKR